MAKVIWTGPALRDLEFITKYIALDSPRYAERFAKRLVRTPRALRSHPRMGRVVPEFDRESTRELIYGAYRLVYEIRADDCYVTAVIHASRDFLQHYEAREWDVTD